ncbi:uncharacterized protein METZ01_LOCUS466531, partial [marine metagenome]
METDALTRLSYAPMHKIINKVAYKPSSVLLNCLHTLKAVTIYLGQMLPFDSS